MTSASKTFGLTDRELAVATLMRFADEYGSRGRWLRLEVQNMTRAEFDSHTGDERFHARTDDRGAFWSKYIELAPCQARSFGMVGAITLSLMTNEPPVAEGD